MRHQRGDSSEDGEENVRRCQHGPPDRSHSLGLSPGRRECNDTQHQAEGNVDHVLSRYRAQPDDALPLRFNDVEQRGSQKDPEEPILVVVYDMLGKEKYSKILITEDKGLNVFAIDPSGTLTSGMYMITATSNGSTLSKRLVIK